jgi:hypothetical protein
MSQTDEKIALYTEELSKYVDSVDADLLKDIVSKLGPSIFSTDSELVSSSDEAEMGRVVKFIINKLAMDSTFEKVEAAAASAVETMGASNPKKYRAVFCYLAKKAL